MNAREICTIISGRVSMREAAERYGLRPDRTDFIICPFHHEDTASLKLYRDHWWCYGCQTGGDLVTFVRKYFGLSFSEAVAKINDDFRLNINLSRERGERPKPMNDEQFERILERRRRNQERARLEQEQQRLIDLHRFYWQTKKLYEPVRNGDEIYFNPCLVEALKELPRVEYELDEITQKIADLKKMH